MNIYEVIGKQQVKIEEQQETITTLTNFIRDLKNGRRTLDDVSLDNAQGAVPVTSNGAEPEDNED